MFNTQGCPFTESGMRQTYIEANPILHGNAFFLSQALALLQKEAFWNFLIRWSKCNFAMPFKKQEFQINPERLTFTFIALLSMSILPSQLRTPMMIGLMIFHVPYEHFK